MEANVKRLEQIREDKERISEIVGVFLTLGGTFGAIRRTNSR